MLQESGVLTNLKLVLPEYAFFEIDEIGMTTPTENQTGLLELIHKVTDYVSTIIKDAKDYRYTVSEITEEPNLEKLFISETDRERKELKKDNDHAFDFFKLIIVTAIGDTSFKNIQVNSAETLKNLVNKYKTITEEHLFGVELFLCPIPSIRDEGDEPYQNKKTDTNNTSKRYPGRPQE